ncbi:DUF2971 domain-containing protein [Salmonella enterica subsp. enterica serovar Infantis]|nr:DUF2971 domain-containing protein [Salmonella enterica]EIL4305587.1 DUF2971 domain-containing protein [Salmonella enterica subsp. enterica serovar Infantis]
MLYKYVGHEDPNELIKILKFFIEDGTIRATRPHDFNDPAEFKAKFSFDATIPEKRVRYYEMWPGKSDEDGENWLRGRTKNAEEFDAYMLRGNLLLNTGVICLTRTDTNYLMWSHYASSHSGFCIGFDDAIVEALDDQHTALNGDVEYVKSPPEVNFYTADVYDIVRAIFLHKGESWKYEEEFRIISELPGIKKFDTSLIKEISIGCKPYPELESFARELLDSNLAVYKMLCPTDSYQLKRVELDKNLTFQVY